MVELDGEARRVPEPLVADGLLFAYAISPGRAAPLERGPIVPTLGGAEITVGLPPGFRVSWVSWWCLISHRHRSGMAIGFQCQSRGWGLWQIADHPGVQLLEIAEEPDGALLALYRLTEEGVGDGHFTLLQSEHHDVTTDGFASLAEASAMFDLLQIRESGSGVTLELDDWVVDQDEVTMTILNPEDPHDDLILSVLPGDQRSAEDWLDGPGNPGRHADFWLLGESVESGIAFATPNAIAYLVPGSQE